MLTNAHRRNERGTSAEEDASIGKSVEVKQWQVNGGAL